jgi:hypothetical protein
LSLKAVQVVGYHQRSRQVVLQSIKRLHANQCQFATRGQGRLFYSLMVCRKCEILCTDILDCDTCNIMERSQLLYGYDCCMFVYRWYVSQVIYMYNPIHLHHRRNTAGSSVINRGKTNNSMLDGLDLADALILSWAPIFKFVFQRCSHKCGIALGFDVCWVTSDISA